MNEKVMEQMVDHREELVKHEEVVDVEEQAQIQEFEECEVMEMQKPLEEISKDLD